MIESSFPFIIEMFKVHGAILDLLPNHLFLEEEKDGMILVIGVMLRYKDEMKN